MGTNVGNVGGTQNYYNQYASTKKSGKDDGNSINDLLSNPVDTYTPGPAGAKDPATINRLWTETNHAAEAVRKLVSSALGKNDASGQTFWANRASGNFKLPDADRAQAQQLISEDGFFGVKQTSARIMDFAKALVGEGASDEQIEKMRSAVQKGFDEVSKMFGGFDNLPEVSKDTHKAIMQAFDDWKAGSKTSKTETA